jgi:uncharacterized membrane protein YeaQ/YmgE (transglycosylase-associated protein family)
MMGSENFEVEVDLRVEKDLSSASIAGLTAGLTAGSVADWVAGLVANMVLGVIGDLAADMAEVAGMSTGLD